MSPATTLANRAPPAPVTSGPIETLIAATPAEPADKPAAAATGDHTVQMGIVRHLRMDVSLGSATVLRGEARRLTGPDVGRPVVRNEFVDGRRCQLKSVRWPLTRSPF